VEWVEGRITKRSVDAGKAPQTTDAITELAYIEVDKLELTSAREKIFELIYEIEALKREHSGSYVERLKSELSASYVTNRGFLQQLEEEREEFEKLNAGLKHEKEQNEKVNAALKREREENDKMNAALKREREESEKLSAELRFALLENDNLIGLTRSLRERADASRAILEVMADWLERASCPRRLPKIIEANEEVADDLAA
jgi:septal ring factor EnvC (AmiA/AmiB activator)